MKRNTKIIIILTSIFIGVFIIIVALLVSRPKDDTVSNSSQVKLREISLGELQKADGKNNNKCWLAVDGKVYEITDSALWNEGKHTPSEEQAYCGDDMTDAMNSSPHGRKKLEQLTEIGILN